MLWLKVAEQIRRHFFFYLFLNLALSFLPMGCDPAFALWLSLGKGINPGFGSRRPVMTHLLGVQNSKEVNYGRNWWCNRTVRS